MRNFHSLLESIGSIRSCLALAAAAVILPCAAFAGQKAKLGSFNPQDFSMHMPAKGNQWMKSLRHSPFQKSPKKVVSEGDTKIGPVNSFGTLDAPDGTEWVYTASYDFDARGSYTAAHLTIYDSDGKVIGTINDTFTLKEHQTSVNQVMIDPNVTKKFFNVDDKYEVIIFVHVTTDDYMGYCYQDVFSLDMDQNEPLLTLPGYEVLIADFATDQWSEKKQMVMMRETMDDDNYYILYDVYEHAGWGSANAPKLLHTFAINYELLAGSGSNAYPITMQNINGKPHYAISYYEKPFFDPNVPITEEPVVNPDNHLLIDIYSNDCFEVAEGEEVKPLKTVRIAMETREGFSFTMPGIGGLMGNDDFSVSLFDSSSKPYFVVTCDNYVPSSDSFITDFLLYDEDGNLVKTIARDAYDYIRLNDMPGSQIQFCVTNDEEEMLQFLNIPDCEIVAQIPYVYDERLLSASIDRVPAKDGFNIVVAGSQGESDGKDNILHPIGYFNADGTLNHWDLVNLGPDVMMAQPAIISSWLNPYLFDTDPAMDYMFLVKLQTDPTGQSTATEERLWVLNKDGKKLVDYGPTAEMGDLNSIAVLNAATSKPVLSVAYYKWDTDVFTLNFNNLPLSVFPAGGSGTEDDPYLISTAGDLMQIQNAPAAHYKVVNNIACGSYPFAGNNTQFSGTLDGQNFAISDLVVRGDGLISQLVGSAVVKNLRLVNPVMVPQSLYAGIIASTARYDGATAPVLNNIHMHGALVADDSFDGTFGGIIGQLTTGTTLSECSMADANINLPRAVAGGIVGEVATSSANVNAVAFKGTLLGDVAGGVVGHVALINLSNAHVNADIYGNKATGGIVGEIEQYSNNRGTFAKCFVEGTFNSMNAKDAAVGGIAGYVTPGENKCVSNTVVALDEVTFPENVELQSAHRVIGHSRIYDPGEINWEDPWWDEYPGDPYEHPELWPREPQTPDPGFDSNHAIASLAPVNGDEEMAKDATSVEGKSVEEITEAFLAEQGFAFGSDAENPWAAKDGKFYLWFEPEVFSGAPSVKVEQKIPSVAVKGNALLADGMIEVFSVAGAKVASGSKSLAISHLAPGVYVAICNGEAVKFIVK